MDDFKNDEQSSSNQTPFQNNTSFEYQNAYGEPKNTQVNQTPYQSTPPQDLQFQQPYITGASFTPPPEPPKKSHGKLIAFLVAAVLILTVGITCYAKKDYLANALALSTKSPQEYYTSVEKDAIKSGLSSYNKLYDKSAIGKDIAYKISTDVSFDQETISSLLQGLGADYGDLESSLGIDLDSLGADITVATKDGATQALLAMDINKVNIISSEIYMDTVTQEILLRVPELNAAWLNLSPETATSSINYQELLSTGKITELLERYSNIIIDHVDKVELNKDKVVKIDSISEECTELVITIEEDDLKDIALAVLTEAKEDKVIYDLLPSFQLSQEEYIVAIDKAITEIQTEDISTTTYGSLKMMVYVNKNGNIIGRDFVIYENNVAASSFGYYSTEKNNKYELKAYFNDETGEEVFSVIGSAKKDNDSYTGNCTFTLANQGTLNPLSDITFEIEFEDAKQVTKNDKTFYYGTYTFSSISLMGAEIILDYNVVDGVQHSKIDVQFGSTSLLTFNTVTEYLDNYSFSAPSDTDQIYGTNEYNSYMESIDFDKFISDLSDKLGSDILKDMFLGLDLDENSSSYLD